MIGKYRRMSLWHVLWPLRRIALSLLPFLFAITSECVAVGVKSHSYAGFVPTPWRIIPPRRAALSGAIAGIQPSGGLHVGNYIGCIQPAVQYQNAGGELTFLIADLHATTGREPNLELSDRTRRTVATLLACGIDPSVTNVILQSDFPEILELHWIIGTVISLGRLRKLANFERRDLAQEKDSVAQCLYPLLMAADVLCSGSDTIIAGADQSCHICVVREVADKLNRRAASTVVCVPEVYQSSGFKVLSLDGSEKMSKSSSKASSRVNLTDSDSEIFEKLRAAKTSSTNDASSPEVANLIRLLSFFSGEPPSSSNDDMQFSVLKQRLHEAMSQHLAPIRERYNTLMLDDEAVLSALRAGRQRMKPVFSSIVEVCDIRTLSH
ncbi:Tryptophan--tRNA ligase [Babesia sp. Xinjiang]|uniref:Tryptophan--tRNA ligase n=1 Tax=Babesia sp. Xinjiang TaxID=462227 RepID=UPI000A219612|nr:Tryptophan--tRNA ligase [Babesia sp. Xinjiang]ORM39963.1 Tryptophan--tRNA ligase [Babesia sp. Xinjiang]